MIVLVLLIVAVRGALPEVLRRVAVDQLNQLLLGDVRIGDVDLAILRGAVALEDVGLRAAGDAAGAPEMIAWRRLAVNVGWLSLARRTVRLQDFELTGLAIHLDRLADGALRLPQLRESEEEEEEVPEPEEPPAEDGEAWAVTIEHAALRDGAVLFRDRVAEPPFDREFELPALQVDGLHLQPAPEAGPGKAKLRVGIRDGSLAVAARVRARPDGYAIQTRVRLTAIPLDRIDVHVPELGWSGSEGRLDGNLSFHMAPDRGPELAGRIALHDLEVRTPGEKAPVLAFDTFEVTVGSIDLGRSDARIERVGLRGARLLVHPLAPAPLPLLAGIMGETPPRNAEASAVEEEPAGEEAPAPAAPAASGAPAPPAPAPAAPAETSPWTWRVAEVDLRDTHLTVLLEPPPLEIDVVSATVIGLASEPGSLAKIALEVHEGDGRIGIDGQLGLDPLSTDVAIELAGLDVGRLTAASGAVPMRLAGTLGGHLGFVLDPEAIVVEGTLDLAKFEAALPEGEGFGVAWDDLAIEAREVRLDQSSAGPVRVHLAAVSLKTPKVVVTRTADGFILPAAGGAPAAAEGPAGTAEAAAETAPPADGAAAATSPFEARVDRLDVEGGKITFHDQSVEPAFEGKITRLKLGVRGVAVPGGVPDRLDVSCRVAGAPLTVTGVRRGDTTHVTVVAKELPLRPFNPYASASGYRVAAGTVTLESDARWSKTAYDADSEFSIDQLAVAGAGGESLFQKRFGLPLSVAIALLKDVQGRIALAVPVEGDQSGTRVDIGSIIAQALTRAITGALISPLKLLGAVNLKGGRIESFDPRPIPFAPGTDVATTAGRKQTAQLGRMLEKLPSVMVAITGGAGTTDVRGLKEMAVLAELEETDTGMLGGIRNALSFGKRDAIRNALAARARGEDGPLDDDDRETLDEWVAERTVTEADLQALAARRVESVRAVLVDEQGVDAARVSVQSSMVDAQSSNAEVTIEIASPDLEDEP